MQKYKPGDHVVYIPGNQHGVVRSVNERMPDHYFVVYDNAVMRMVTGQEPYTAQNTSARDLRKE